MRDLRTWARNNRWLLAFIVVIAMGYQAGKDLALRDNSTEANSR